MGEARVRFGRSIMWDLPSPTLKSETHVNNDWILDAAKIIEDRLSASYSPQLHCHHCQWILYLAGLICWAFGFTVTESMRNEGIVQKGLVVSTDQAKEQCTEYLKVATKLQVTGLDSVTDQVNKTTGLLIRLIGVLKEENGSGLIAEAADVLKRLVEINGLSESQWNFKLRFNLRLASNAKSLTSSHPPWLLFWPPLDPWESYCSSGSNGYNSTGSVSNMSKEEHRIGILTSPILSGSYFGGSDSPAHVGRTPTSSLKLKPKIL